MVLTKNSPSQIPFSIIDKSRKCVCKINTKSEYGSIMATGFFMKVSNSSRYLVSSCHAIGDAIKNNTEIEIEIWNNTRIILTSNGRFTKTFEEGLDIAVIEIKDSDNIFNAVEFFDYDMNYMKGYKIYEKVDVFSIQYALGSELACSSGKITQIETFQFYHNISTERGSSGAPIILTSSNRVIGTHTAASHNMKLNVGTFIGEIIKEIDIPHQMNNNIQNNDKNKIFSTKNNSIINNKNNYNINNKISN